jgi:hypothetical protein
MVVQKALQVVVRVKVLAAALMAVLCGGAGDGIERKRP